MAHFLQKMDQDGNWNKILDDLVSRRTDPYSLVEAIMARELSSKDRGGS